MNGKNNKTFAQRWAIAQKKGTLGAMWKMTEAMSIEELRHVCAVMETYKETIGDLTMRSNCLLDAIHHEILSKLRSQTESIPADVKKIVQENEGVSQ